MTVFLFAIMQTCVSMSTYQSLQVSSSLSSLRLLPIYTQHLLSWYNTELVNTSKNTSLRNMNHLLTYVLSAKILNLIMSSFLVVIFAFVRHVLYFWLNHHNAQYAASLPIYTKHTEYKASERLSIRLVIYRQRLSKLMTARAVVNFHTKRT